MLVQWCCGGCGNPATPLPNPPANVVGAAPGTDAGPAPMDGYLYGMKDGAWVKIPQTRTFEYSYNSTVAEPPGGGQLRMNNVDPHLATLLWVSGTDAPGVDGINVLKQADAGIGYYIQDKDDSSKWAAYNVTGSAVVKGAYVEIPVQFKQGTVSVLPAGQRVLLTNTTRFV